uniref:DHC_N1 domain-containing protein n=1 Tax=Caenorhabditis tropicalis TaxID=1561998 RepID=A0A1I7U735_9PELO
MPRKRRSEDVDGMVIATSPIKIKVEQFIEETSSMDMYIPALDRVLWGFVVVFFIGLTFYQVFERVTYYFIKNPLTTRRSYETLSNMYFPTIGVCNKMQLKASSIASKNPDLLRGMCSVLDEDTSNSTRFDELDKFDDVDILDLYRNSIQSADDLFVSCEFGKSGSCQDEIRPMYTPFGLCYSVSPNKTILRPGPETTLSLVLNLEVHEIIPGTVVEPGVVLSIYDGASSLSHYSEGIHLEAGKVVTIPVNEVRKLRLHESSCGSTKMESFSEKEYSKAACEWSVSVKQIEKECGCIPIRNPIYRGVFDNKNDHTDNTTEIPKKKYKKWKKRKIPRCTLRQEIECVQEKLNIRPHIDDTVCPDDCEDISFSSIVFGGKLSASEIVSMLPSDWEDTKEKRLAAYQKALEVIPNRMIPVVRNVQQLADELQLFVKEASEV